MPKKISPDKRLEILSHYLKGGCYAETARRYDVAPSTVRKIYVEFKGFLDKGPAEHGGGGEPDCRSADGSELSALNLFLGSKVPAYKDFVNYLFLERLNPRTNRADLDALDYKSLISVFGALTDKFLKISEGAKEEEGARPESELVKIYEMLKKPGKAHELGGC